MTTIEGRVWTFGDNISADNGIIQYSQVPDLGSFDIPALKAMCFVLFDPDFPTKVREGDIVVAGTNFGHHSHPHACVAMIASGIRACLCESTDSAFIRKALNVGLPVIPCPGITRVAVAGDRLSIDLASGQVLNPRTSQSRRYRPFCPEMIEVWRHGGLSAALRARIAARASVGDD